MRRERKDRIRLQRSLKQVPQFAMVSMVSALGRRFQFLRRKRPTQHFDDVGVALVVRRVELFDQPALLATTC